LTNLDPLLEAGEEVAAMRVWLYSFATRYEDLLLQSPATRRNSRIVSISNVDVGWAGEGRGHGAQPG